MFFVDAMLGNIARKLRLLGYDSKYFSDINDTKLIDIAIKDKRIIISKDYELILRAQKFGIQTIYITKQKLIEQFLELTNKICLKNFEINGNIARCTKCNSLTESIDKNNYKEKIPPRVFNLNENYWRCKNCDKIYWEGTHIKNLQVFVGQINERLQ
ncbi:MAG: hypothetical protein HC944_03825 [Nanoarchaeota archaeon]|nr:hypothetical protein [Nanoarchaeota archaeon]